MAETRELVSASEIARRLKRTRRGVALAIERLDIRHAAEIDGNRKVYAPEVIEQIGENMRATEGGGQ